MNEQPPKTPAPKSDTRARYFAWASLAFAIASWVLSAAVVVGLDVVAVVLGIVALQAADAASVPIRRIAKAGLFAGGAKLLFVAGTFAWVFIAFMINPVAH
ncbi:hypothetical protein K8I61_18260 [bacterium]|nr:hypothetical protein [bacterium]